MVWTRWIKAALLLLGAGLWQTALAVESSCIVAGRLNSAGQWAPRMPGIELLAADGTPVRSTERAALEAVRQVKVMALSLLSACDGNNELAKGGEEPTGKKAPAPALKADKAVLEVQQVSFPRLRSGGELVELQLRVPPDRVVLLTR